MTSASKKGSAVTGRKTGWSSVRYVTGIAGFLWGGLWILLNAVQKTQGHKPFLETVWPVVFGIGLTLIALEIWRERQKPSRSNGMEAKKG